MTQPTPIPEARELMFDGQALLDELITAKLAGTVDRPAVDLNVRYRFRDNEQAASVAFDVADAFFSPLLSALYGDIATLQAERDTFREHSTTLNAVGFQVAEALADEKGADSYHGDPVRDVTRLIAQRDSLLAAAKAVVDAGRCAGLGSVGAALVAAVEAVGGSRD